MSHFNDTDSRNRLAAVIAYVVAAMLGAVGQLCFKLAAVNITSSADRLSAAGCLAVAGASYFAVMGLFIFGLKRWGEMSVLYPIYGSTFVFALALSSVWSHEQPSPRAVAGTIIIVIGIALINRSKERT